MTTATETTATESIKCGDCGIETFLPSKCEVCGKSFVLEIGERGELRLTCGHSPAGIEADAMKEKGPTGPSSRDVVPGFGKAIRARRELAEMTMQELADKAETHQTTVSKIEKEQRAPSLLLAAKLAKALGVGVDVLLKDVATLSGGR